MSSTGDRTHRVVAGALCDAINKHGAITENLVPSATKRVVAQLRAAAENGYRVHQGDESAAAALEAVQKRYAKLKHGHEIALRQLAAVQQQRDELLRAALRPEVDA